SGETESAEALLSKPSAFSSLGKASAGRVVSPSRSRTVLSYSVRVRRRIGAGPGFGTPPPHSGSELEPVPGPLISPSQPARDTTSRICSPLRTRVLRSKCYAYLQLHIFN